MSIISDEELKNLSSITLNLLNNLPENSVFLKERTKFNFHYKQLSKEFCFQLVLSLNERNGGDDSTKEKQDEIKLNNMLNSDHDVIPNEYEGGFKIWEGLFDLISYMDRSNFLLSTNFHKTAEEITILELGCGSGLLSIFIAQQLKHKLKPESKFKIFLQDYNYQVIKYFTIPNVLINELRKEEKFKTKDNVLDRYKFMFGDWHFIKEMLIRMNIKFDLIVASEIIYREENYKILLEIFHQCLKDINGQVLIASKSHYFGLGGGTYSFLDFLDSEQQNTTKNEYYLSGDVVEEIEETLVRHIILLKWKMKHQTTTSF